MTANKVDLKFLIRHITVELELAAADEEMDGTTALASVATAAAGGGRSFNMVFMDNIMKKMHGQEAARSMR